MQLSSLPRYFTYFGGGWSVKKMDSIWQILLTAGIASLVSITGLWLNERRARRKEPLEDAGDAVDTAVSASTAIKSYVDEVNRLRTEVTDLRKEMTGMFTRIDKLERSIVAKDLLIDQWRIGIKKLINQLISAGFIPCWKPDDEEVNTISNEKG
jgi:hypothetical protein